MVCRASRVSRPRCKSTAGPRRTGLQIDGRTAPDGTAALYAKGRTESKEFVPGRDMPRGTGYGYSIDTHFGAATGTGTRIEARPNYQFVKQ